MNSRILFLIALTTYRESIRSRILYSLLIFGGLVIGTSALFGAVTIGDQIQVIQNFGLLCTSLFSVAFAVISGSALLHKELSRRTVYNILAKPVRRSEFLFGKYLGLLYTSCVMISLMGIGLCAFLLPFSGRIHFEIPVACLFIMLELSIVCAAAIFFSSIVVTPLLIGLFTFGLFLAGRSTDHLLYFVQEVGVTGSAAIVLRTLYTGLPHLELLNVSDRLVFGHTIGIGYVLWSAAYAAGYAGSLLIAGNILFKRREFN